MVNDIVLQSHIWKRKLSEVKQKEKKKKKHLVCLCLKEIENKKAAQIPHFVSVSNKNLCAFYIDKREYSKKKMMNKDKAREVENGCKERLLMSYTSVHLFSFF